MFESIVSRKEKSEQLQRRKKILSQPFAHDLLGRNETSFHCENTCCKKKRGGNEQKGKGTVVSEKTAAQGGVFEPGSGSARTILKKRQKSLKKGRKRTRSRMTRKGGSSNTKPPFLAAKKSLGKKPRKSCFGGPRDRRPSFGHRSQFLRKECLKEPEGKVG